MSADADFLEGTSDATIAAYFRQGLFAGLLSIEAPKDWAYEMIRLREAPSIELIEIATTYRLHDMEALLAQICPGADLDQAGRWLLKDIVQRLEDGTWDTRHAVQYAMEVAWSTGLPENIEWNCYGLLDSLDLAGREIDVDIATIKRETIEFLQSECRDRHHGHQL